MPAGAEVLFINKTARSGKLSQSRGSERARIYSHVQRGSHRQAPARAPKEAEVLYQLPDSWASESGRDESSTPPKLHPKRRSQSKNRRAKVQVQTDAATRAMQALQLSSRPQQLVSLNALSGGAGDPFDSLRAPMSPYMEDLLKFYSSDVVPRIFPIKDVANTARLYTLTRAFEDPLQRDALLCTTSAAIFADSGIARHGVAAMAFKSKTLVSLQRQLSQPQRSKATSFSSMYSVALLLYVECLLGNLEDLAAHIAGLNVLVHNSDVYPHDTPPCIFATLFACSYLGAALLDVAPNLKPIDLGSCSEISQAAQAALAEVVDGPSPMANRLFTKYADFLGPPLLEVAIKQRDVMHFRCICGGGVYDPSPSDVQYMYGQEMSVEYQLTALRADETLSPAQHAVRIALFVFPQPFILIAKPNAAFCRAMTKRIKKWLDKSDLVNLWAPKCDLLLWVFFVLAHISIGEAEWPWVLSYFSTLIDFLGLQSVDEMEQLLHGFYYHPLYFRVTAERIWEEHELVSSKEVGS